jgi:hypothetical protein
MNEEQNNFPCKCGHEEVRHGIEEELYGGYVWLDDLNKEVWQEDSQPIPICYDCNGFCVFGSMNNLEYLEWKHAQSQSSSKD